MGITIHFEDTLKDETAYEAVVSEASKFATEMKWHARSISEEKVTLLRVNGEEDLDYVGPTKGIEIRPHENSEPLRLVCYKVLDAYLEQEDKYYGPVRSADGRIIDVLEKD